MVELGGGLGFLLKAGHQLGIPGHVRRQHLDRHLPLQHEVLSQEDHSHAAATKESGDLVATLKGAREAHFELIEVGVVFDREGTAVGAVTANGDRSMALGAVAQRSPPSGENHGKSRQVGRTPPLLRRGWPKRVPEVFG